MSNTNPMNTGVITGKLVAKPDIKSIPNSEDASVRFRVSVRRNYKTHGKYELDFVQFSSYFTKASKSKLLDRLKSYPTGGFLTVAYHVQSYTKNESVQISLTADTITFIENRDYNCRGRN